MIFGRLLIQINIVLVPENELFRKWLVTSRFIRIASI